MSTILIKNGRVIDPSNFLDETTNILIADGKIKKIGTNIRPKADQVIDATGLVVTPGLIDLQVHFREPGREDKETIETGSRAALKGGVTSVVTMPNTNPIIDNQAVIEFIINRARELNLINVYPAGAISQKQEGFLLAEIWEMKNSGAVAITEDGLDIQNEGLLRKAFEYAKTHDFLVMSHCETNSLTEGGVMHEGLISAALGLPGTPAASEDLAVHKNIYLAELTGARLHLLHNSTKGAVELIKAAKKRRLAPISAEVSVQHFALTDEECLNYNTNSKMYPPLRSEEHRQAIIKAIQEGVIDCLTTDHAPHIEPDKLKPFEDAAFGSVGLETSFAVVNTYLLATDLLSLSAAIKLMTINPAQIIGLDRGHLSVGAVADIALFDLEEEWTVNSKELESKGKNSVFNGKKLQGKAQVVIRGGEVKLENGTIVV
jgi:dihydroorotase